MYQNYPLAFNPSFMDVCFSAGEDKHLWKTILMLEMGIKHSKHNCQMLLLLMRLYCLAGG